MLRVVGLVVFAGSGRSAAAPTNAIAAAAAAPEGLQVLKNAETFPEEPQARVLVVSAGRSGAGLVGAILNRAPGLPFYVHEPCRAMASDTLPPPPSSALTISLSSSQSSLPPSPSSKLIPGPSTCTALLARVLHCNFTPGDAAAHLFSFPEDVAESQALSAIADPAWPAGPAALSVRRQHERDGSDGSKRLTPEGERHAGAVAACRAASLVVVVSDIARLVGTASHASNSSKAKQLKMQASNAARQPEAGGAGAGLSELLGGGIATHLLHVVRHPIAAAYSRLTDPAPLLAPGLGPTAAPGDEGSSARGDPCVVARRGERAVIQRLSLDACARRACAAAAASNDAVKAAAAAHRRSHQRDPSNHSGDGDVSGGGTGATGGAAVANKRAARHGDADDDANLEVVGALVHRVERSSTARRVRGTGWVPPASERVAKVSALGAVAELQFEALARDPVAGTQALFAWVFSASGGEYHGRSVLEIEPHVRRWLSIYGPWAKPEVRPATVAAAREAAAAQASAQEASAAAVAAGGSELKHPSGAREAAWSWARAGGLPEKDIRRIAANRECARAMGGLRYGLAVPKVVPTSKAGLAAQADKRAATREAEAGGGSSLAKRALWALIALAFYWCCTGGGPAFDSRPD